MRQQPACSFPGAPGEGSWHPGARKLSGIELTEQRFQPRLCLCHAGPVAFNEADVEGFLGGVVVVDVADGDPGLTGDIADGRAVIALANKQSQGDLFDGRLVPF